MGPVSSFLTSRESAKAAAKERRVLGDTLADALRAYLKTLENIQDAIREYLAAVDEFKKLL